MSPLTLSLNKRRSSKSSGRLRSTQTRPRRHLARAQLTWNLRNRFPHERAITDLRRALRSIPTWPKRTSELGKVYLHIGLTDKAVDANEQAQRLDPGAAAPTNRRLDALIDAGRLEEVRHELDRNGTRLLPPLPR